MGFFHTSSATAPTYTGLQLQTATNTLPVPIVWGKAKISVNVLWYANFQYVNGNKKGKGFFGAQGGQEQYYTADIILALCEGPIFGIGTIWRDQSTFTLAELEFTLFDGTTPQAVWSYLEDNYPNQALAYQGTAYLAEANYALGDSATLSNHNFEVEALWYGTGSNGIDADPAHCFDDFLFSPQFGVGFNPASLDMSTLFGNSGDNSLQSYCQAQGIAMSPALVDQEQASSVLTRWLQICNCAAFWSAGQLKFAPYGDVPIVEGTQITQTVQFGVPIPVPVAFGPPTPPSIIVAPPANFVSDGGVKYAFSGVPLTYIGAGIPGAVGEYGIDPPGTYLFAGGDESQTVAITFTRQVTWGYSPNVTPVYSLDDNNYIDAKDNTDPVQASRVDPFELPGIQRIEICDRNNQYDLTPIEARDLSQVQIYGPRVGSTITAHEICDASVVGPVVAQTILQRLLYVRRNFKFKLGPEYCLLDPMDVVAITDVGLGLNSYPVRIISIEEDDTGVFLITAEELVIGVSTPAFYQTSPNTGGGVNRAEPAGPVNAPPLIYEPGTAITLGSPQVWLGASGGAAGVFDDTWGGAYVWASLDDVSYTQLAAVTAKMNQGVLTGSLPLVSGYDTTSTLAVDLAESQGVLDTVTMSAAQQGVTLCLIDSELLAFTTATLTSAYNYNLTGLQRGMFGTAPAAHSSTADFYRVDNTIVKQPLPTNYIGVPLYFKFQSYNLFGGGVQDLSTVTAYPYTPTGIGYQPPGAITAKLTSVDMNATGDNAIAFTLPGGTQYQFVSILLSNASVPLSAAQAGVFTGAAQTGATIAAEQSLSGVTPTASEFLTLAVSPGTIFTSGTIYFNVGTAQGAAATVDVTVTIVPVT